MRNDLLVGRQAAQHFLVDGAIAHAIDEGLDDLEVDVRFEQRHPDFAERQLDRLFGEPSLAADAGGKRPAGGWRRESNMTG